MMAERGGPHVLMTVEQLRRSVPGGIGAYARGLLSGLAANDSAGTEVDITLYASRFRGGGTTPDPLEGFGRPVVLSRLPGPLMIRSWDRGFSRLPAGFDIVHSVSLASPPQRGSHRAASVITVHDLAWRRYPNATTRRGRRWHEAALRRARDSDARLVVTSGFVAADLADDGVDSDRITIVQGGSDHLVAADPEATASVLRQLGVANQFILTVGTLEPRKNLDRLLAAYAQVRPTLPEPWPLVIVGPDGWGPARPRSEDHDGVVFAGAVADGVLSGLYAQARAFVYVPLTEGYGLPPLEAMRSGVPSVVSSEVPSVHDLGQTDPAPVLIVDPLDVDAIAEALLVVLTDEAVRADLAQRGKTYALARTWAAAAQSHVTLWSSLT